MKTSIRYLSAILGLAAAGPLAFAADGDNPIKKDQHIIIRHGDDFPPGPTTTITFLGVETAPASRTLTEQLGLAPETGLVVNMVAPDSPAAAVLKPHDVLVKLDDQKLIETRQLAVLVRGHKEGDEVTLTFIRGGKEATAKVKLAKHDLPDMHHGSWQEESDRPWQHFAPGSDGLRRLGEAPGLPREEMDRLLPLINMGREMHAEVIHPGHPGGADPEVTSVNTSNSSMVFSDDAGTLEVKVVNGKKDVLAKNAKGDVLFSGPFNTDEERKAAPPEVRARVDKLERMEGFQFRADADFQRGETEVVVPTAHRIRFAPAPRPGPVTLPAPPQML